MKKAIKFLALCLAAVFIVAACSAPDASLSERDYSEYNKSKNDLSVSDDPGATQPWYYPTFENKFKYDWIETINHPAGPAYPPYDTDEDDYGWVGTGTTWHYVESLKDWLTNVAYQPPEDKWGSAPYDEYEDVIAYVNDSLNWKVFIFTGDLDATLADSTINDQDMSGWSKNPNDYTSAFYDTSWKSRYYAYDTADGSPGGEFIGNGEDMDEDSPEINDAWDDPTVFPLNWSWEVVGSHVVHHPAGPDVDAWVEYVPHTDYIYAVESVLTYGGEVGRELDIFFPEGLDVVTAADTEAALKEFLGFYTFTPLTAADLTANPYKVNTLTTAYDYTFVKKSWDYVNGQSGWNITVRLTDLPAKNLVLKIDGTKYKANGYPVAFVAYEAGSPVYNDIYQQVDIVKSGVLVDSDPFIDPQNVGLSIGIAGIGDYTFNDDTTAAGLIQKVRITINDPSTLIATKELQAILDDDIADRFVVQQFKGGKWEAVFKFAEDKTYTASYGPNLTANVKMEDNATFRVIGQDLFNIKTSSVFYGVNQTIQVYDTNSNPINSKAKIYDFGSMFYYNTDTHEKLSYIGIFDKSYDSKGKNIVFTLEFDIPELEKDGKYTYYNLAPLADYNKHFKLAYSPSGAGLGASDLVYLKINSFEYIKDRRKVLDPTNPNKVHPQKDVINCIKITLDPNVTTTQLRAATLLLSPEFKYDDPKGIYHYGDYSNNYYVIDGVRNFAYYSTFSGF